LIGGGCATTPPYNPFKIAQEEFYGKIKTIALAPVGVPMGLEDPDPVKAKFESLVEAKLREAGFSVVSSRESAGIFESMNKQLGGMFDPVTGKRDETKFKTVREHFLREVQTKFKADAVLYPNIRVVTASFAGGQASWDGTKESLSTTEGFMGLLLVGQLRGTAPALSLVVTIEDIHGVDAYVNGGGIQLSSKISAGNFVPVPRNQLFNSDERNAAAVNFALGPLVRIPAPAGAPKVQP
jgi:hypothetical protein